MNTINVYGMLEGCNRSVKREFFIYNKRKNVNVGRSKIGEGGWKYNGPAGRLQIFLTISHQH